MDVLISFARSFFFALIGVSIGAGIVYLASLRKHPAARHKLDIALVLGAPLGIGIARGIETQWPMLSEYNLFVIGFCVALSVSVVKFFAAMLPN